jgi:CRP/FNR family cyclic AMP-dependent transcriptional regulator
MKQNCTELRSFILKANRFLDGGTESARIRSKRTIAPDGRAARIRTGHFGPPGMAKGFNLAEVQEVCGSADTVSLNPGEFLFQEGDPAHAFYIVKAGVLRIVSGSTVYETLRAGGIVGEMAIVEEEGRRSASVIAGTHAELLEFDAPKFLSLVAQMPEFSLAVMRVMAQRLRVMNQRHRTDR